MKTRNLKSLLTCVMFGVIMALAQPVIADSLTIRTETYEILGYGCTADAFTWIESDRYMGSATASNCTGYNLWFNEFERPVIGSAETTVSPFDVPPIYFECALVGLSSADKNFEFWCDDDPFFGLNMKYKESQMRSWLNSLTRYGSR